MFVSTRNVIGFCPVCSLSLQSQGIFSAGSMQGGDNRDTISLMIQHATLVATRAHSSCVDWKWAFICLGSLGKRLSALAAACENHLGSLTLTEALPFPVPAHSHSGGQVGLRHPAFEAPWVVLQPGWRIITLGESRCGSLTSLPIFSCSMEDIFLPPERKAEKTFGD